ncbi:unnamed protein product [Nippostrongylus brasiliensis]|uniref:DUF4378 domain-containing protein n=1 Tax=Nippostrongylus brasiliensis TaxID=27835 RepID=A0A0N4XXK1_NIPBR|nr:unnamed protein product [Nippostrongylus brasiliensis]
MYSMDERRPAASPEDGDSSAFLGGLRRGFLAKRFESEDLRCFNPQCPAPLLVIAEHYLNCVDDCVHSAPVYSLFDFATAAGELSSDKAEPKKQKKPYPTHPPESPTPNRAVQVKKRKLTMYTMEKLLEQLESSVENPSGAVLGGKGPDELFGVLKQPEQKCDRFDITGMMLASKLRTLHDINRSRCEKWMVRLDEIMSTIGRAIYEETSLSESFDYPGVRSTPPFAHVVFALPSSPEPSMVTSAQYQMALVNYAAVVAA